MTISSCDRTIWYCDITLRLVIWPYDMVFWPYDMVRWPSDILIWYGDMTICHTELSIWPHDCWTGTIFCCTGTIFCCTGTISCCTDTVLSHRHYIGLRSTWLAGLGGPELRKPPPEVVKRLFWALGSSGKQIADCKPSRLQGWKAAGTQAWQTRDCTGLEMSLHSLVAPGGPADYCTWSLMHRYA